MARWDRIGMAIFIHVDQHESSVQLAADLVGQRMAKFQRLAGRLKTCKTLGRYIAYVCIRNRMAHHQLVAVRYVDVEQINEAG